MSLHAYLNFKGNATEAMNFYAEVLGTEPPSVMAFNEMPPDPNFPVPDECGDWVMHGSINYDGQLIMFSDVLPDREYIQSNNISLLIDMDDIDKLRTLFNKFSDGATITMPFETTFWAKGFGSLIDKFGVEWQFNCT